MDVKDRAARRATLDGYFAAEERYVAGGGTDFSEMAAFLHPDVALHQGPSVPYAGDWLGLAGVEQFFGIYTREWTTLALPEITYYESTRGLAVTLRMQARSGRSGVVVDSPIAHVIAFEDGLIHDHTVFYLDPVQMLAATAGGSGRHHHSRPSGPDEGARS